MVFPIQSQFILGLVFCLNKFPHVGSGFFVHMRQFYIDFVCFYFFSSDFLLETVSLVARSMSVSLFSQ